MITGLSFRASSIKATGLNLNHFHFLKLWKTTLIAKTEDELNW
jgi:hypothetical protein